MKQVSKLQISSAILIVVSYHLEYC